MDALDPAFAPDGSLQKAVNARYRPGGITLWQAEGREQAGTAGGIGGIAGIAWDDPYVPELIYFDGANVQIWPAATVPTDPRFAVSTDIDNVAATPDLMGTLPWEVVPVAGGFFILDGAQPKFVYRIINQRTLVGGYVNGLRGLSIAGVREFKGYRTKPVPATAADINPVVVLSRVAGTTTLSPRSGYTYWAVFLKDASKGIQYGNPLSGGCGTGSVAASIEASPFGSGLGDITIKIHITFAEFLDTSWDYLAVYRNSSGTAVVNSVATSAFPNGIQVGVIRKGDSAWTTQMDQGYAYVRLTVKESQLAAMSNLETNAVFESVVASAAGRTLGVSRDDPPPMRSSTGDVFLDCLMLNDLDNPRKVVYSYPGLYQQFPSGLYYLTFNSGDNDKVTVIKSIGQSAIVLTNTSMWRVSTLPTSADFDFSHGDVQTLLAESTGCPRPQAATRAHLPAPFGTVCVWVSGRGVFATNGFDVAELTSHVDWKKMAVKLDDCHLVDDPLEHRLILHDGNNNLYYLHYHPTHISDGMLAITGPIQRPGGVAHLFKFYIEGGTPQVASIDSAGHLLYEGLGATDDSTGEILGIEAVTKEYYPNGLGAAGSVPKLFAHIAANPSIDGTYGVLATPGPDQNTEVAILESVTRQLFCTSRSIYTEFLTFTLAGAGARDFGINAVGWDWDDHGTT